MWKPLQNTPPYLIKLNNFNDNYEISVTDYRQIWSTSISKLCFFDILMKSNKGLETNDANELIKKGLDMVSNPHSLKKVKIDLEGNKLDVEITKMYDYLLKLKLSLVMDSSENLFQTVIQPLLKTVCDLRSSQFELRELLKKKDKEIDRFRTEGQVPRRDKTHVYNDAAHMTKHTAYEEFFGAAKMPDLLQAGADIEVKKPVPKATRADQTTAGTRQAATKSETLEHPIENNSVPSIVPKLEKNSQNTPNGSTRFDYFSSQPLPFTIIKKEEKGCLEALKESTAVVKKETKTESKDPVPRKRPKNRLNY